MRNNKYRTFNRYNPKKNSCKFIYSKYCFLFNIALFFGYCLYKKVIWTHII